MIALATHVHTPAEPLHGDIDIAAEAAAVPPDYLAKGMFFSRLREKLGGEFGRVAGELSAPPKFGRYLAFNDYPQRDYLLLSGHAARKCYPGLSLCEAMRRLAREDFNVFAGSTVGKVMLSVVSDARRALLLVPSVYSKVAKGDWTLEAQELGPDTVRVDFNPLPGRWEYTLGQLEGVVLAMKGTPQTTVHELPNRHLRFDVRC